MGVLGGAGCEAPTPLHSCCPSFHTPFLSPLQAMTQHCLASKGRSRDNDFPGPAGQGAASKDGPHPGVHLVCEPLPWSAGWAPSFSELMKCHSHNWVLKGWPSILWDSAAQALDKASCHVGGTHVARNQGQPPATGSQGILPAATEGAWKLILPQLGLKITRAQATPRLQLGRDPAK